MTNLKIIRAREVQGHVIICVENVDIKLLKEQKLLEKNAIALLIGAVRSVAKLVRKKFLFITVNNVQMSIKYF